MLQNKQSTDLLQRKAYSIMTVAAKKFMNSVHQSSERCGSGFAKKKNNFGHLAAPAPETLYPRNFSNNF
jgi:hypothetical protein